MSRIALGVAAAIAAAPSLQVQAAADRFDYDPGGRLIRRVDGLNQGTGYAYDPAGNVTEVASTGTEQPPTILNSIADQRRNEVRQVALGGNGLAGAVLTTDHPGVFVTNLASTATALSFRLSVANDVPLGAHSLTVRNASGSVAVPFNVIPAVGFTFVPSPIGLAPDNIARRVTLQLSEPYGEARSFGVSTLSSIVARTATSQITIAPGQTQADFGVIGVAQGSTLLRLNDLSIVQPVESLIFVSAGLESPLRWGPAVGVVRGLPSFVAASSASSASGSVGVTRGLPTFVATSAGSAFSAAIGIARGSPWYAPTNTMWNSGPVGVARGFPQFVSSSATSVSGAVGIVRGHPEFISPTAPLVAPLVGISRL